MRSNDGWPTSIVISCKEITDRSSLERVLGLHLRASNPVLSMIIIIRLHLKRAHTLCIISGTAYRDRRCHRYLNGGKQEGNQKEAGATFRLPTCLRRLALLETPEA